MKLTENVETLGFAVVENSLSSQDIAAYLNALPLSLPESPSVVRRGKDVYAARNLTETVPATLDLVTCVRGIVIQLLGTEVRLVRALLFDKTPRANWSV